MKNFILIVCLNMNLICVGQNKMKMIVPNVLGVNSQINMHRDSSVMVDYIRVYNSNDLPVIFINGKPIFGTFLQGINPGAVDSIYIKKEPICIENRQYH